MLDRFIQAASTPEYWIFVISTTLLSIFSSLYVSKKVTQYKKDKEQQRRERKGIRE